ncbi:MAG TPA: sulfur oxygenase reductase family protein [Smithellaceae bacterium]|jgi:sulfur oxygenase/reductase|nr:sulfur oxygenase reductase family protein [Smithellaceae bacterium]
MAKGKELKSSIYVAINMSKVVNSPESFAQMHQVGPRVCITTASHPGFVGFQANYQTGVLPLAGRYGGSAVDMSQTLNPLRNYQYTMWKNWQDHDEFHEQQFERVFELCGHCLSMVVEGPWEPVYSVVHSKMSPLRSMGMVTDLAADIMNKKDFIRFETPMRCVAVAEHTVKPGTEEQFEKGAIDTMEALANSTGFLGYMILKQIGVCAIGSFMLDPKSMGESLMTLGANPPKNPKPLFKTMDACPSPPEYLIHSEWEAPEMAQLGFAKVLVNHNIRKIHDEGVMSHLIRGPYIMFFQPMMEEPGWRSYLNP